MPGQSISQSGNCFLRWFCFSRSLRIWRITGNSLSTFDDVVRLRILIYKLFTESNETKPFPTSLLLFPIRFQNDSRLSVILCLRKTPVQLLSDLSNLTGLTPLAISLDYRACYTARLWDIYLYVRRIIKHYYYYLSLARVWSKSIFTGPVNQSIPVTNLPQLFYLDRIQSKWTVGG